MDYHNYQLSENIKELTIYYLDRPMTQLPLFLERIIFLDDAHVYKKNIDKSKITFECEIIYIQKMQPKN